MQYIFPVLLFLTACTPPAPVKNENSAGTPASGQLVHMVFFQLKPDADKQAFFQSFETFKSIVAVKHLEIGNYEDFGQPKSDIAEHSIIVRLTFDNLAAFRQYEQHPAHLASIEATKDMLAGPPVGYDYVVK